MVQIFLRPWNDRLNVEGNVSYSQGWRAWNIIRLKKDFLDEFPQLKEAQNKIGYKMVFHRTYDDLMEGIQDMKEQKGPLPILPYLFAKR